MAHDHNIGLHVLGCPESIGLFIPADANRVLKNV